MVWQGAPPPAWGKGKWILRCTKNPGHKGTKPFFASKEEFDMVNSASSGLVKYDTPLGPVELSPESIRLYLSPKATLDEAYMFLQKCRFQRLNPFLGEAYLVIYEQTDRSPRTAAMIIGKEAYTRRAERHPDFLGIEAGLVILREEGVEQVTGAFLGPNDQLLGGWCRVHRKGREVPTFISVSLKEYDNGRRVWKQMPATMIRKVAVVQALREAFPDEMAGLQGGDEFALAEEQPTVVEGQLGHPLRVTTPASTTGKVEDATPREARDPERDIDELYGDGISHEDQASAATEAFDPETAPPAPLPAHVSAMTHFGAVLQEQGWSVERLQAEVLKTPLATYLRSHTLDQAYQLFKTHLANGTP
jgi:phage recombination protein Bet